MMISRTVKIFYLQKVAACAYFEPMHKSSLFKNNCERWALFAPQAAERLSRVVPKGVQHAIQETIPLPNDTVLFMYGIGQGELYEQAKGWLAADKARALVFLEDDLEPLYHLMHTERAKKMLHDEQVRIIFVDEEQHALQKLAYEFALKPYQVLASQLYARTKGMHFQAITQALNYYMDPNLLPHKEYGDMGKNFFTNFYQNLLQLPQAHLGAKLFGQFKDVPAIICGAGPSLEKNLSFLTTLKNRALIFAGGTAMNALNAVGFLPHFGAAIDPNKAQFTRLIMNQAFTVPYFYRNRVFHEALEAISGPHLYIAGTVGYPIGQWFDKALGIDDAAVLDEGLSVLNFSLSLASALGCNPIIFVGADLAYTEEASYSPGIRNHPIHLQSEHFVTKSATDDVLTRLDINKKQIYTLRKWERESLFVTHFAHKHPDKTVINATEGGLGFQMVPNLTLEEAAKRYLHKEYALDTLVAEKISQAKLPPTASRKNIVDKMALLLKSLEKSSRACKPLEKEPAYTHILETYGKYYELMQINALERIKFAHPKEQEKKKAEFLARKYRFMEEAARLNAAILAAVLKQHKDEPAAPGEPPKPQITYKDGKIDGAVLLYHPTGHLKRKVHFKQGLHHGTDQIWNASGQLIIEAEFANDLPVGRARRWHDNGKLALEIAYEQDPAKFTVKEWDSVGNPIQHVRMVPEEHLKALAKETEKVLNVLTQLVVRVKGLKQISQQEAALIASVEEELARLKKTHCGELAREDELLWKGPQAHRQLEQQMQTHIQHLAKNLTSIQAALMSILKSHSSL